MKLLYFSFLLFWSSVALAMQLATKIKLNGKKRTMYKHAIHAQKHPECTTFSKILMTRPTTDAFTPKTLTLLDEQDLQDIKNNKYEYAPVKPLALINGETKEIGILIIGTTSVPLAEFTCILSCLTSEELETQLK